MALKIFYIICLFSILLISTLFFIIFFHLSVGLICFSSLIEMDT